VKDRITSVIKAVQAFSVTGNQETLGISERMSRRQGPIYNVTVIEPSHRHQCLIYEGTPAKPLRALAAILRDQLRQNYRCLYLNDPETIAGLGSHLSAAGVDVAAEVGKGSLILSSDRPHLVEDSFHVQSMICTLEEAIDQAIRDGFSGLFATGDLAWELGPNPNPARLLEYEWRLEKLFHKRPELSGICQYHAGTLPAEAMRQSLLAHPTIFISERQTLPNPHYTQRESVGHDRAAKLDAVVGSLCESGTIE
jgi:hypothetical protein